MAIEKVAVIGAGVMGAGIAAHVANAGLPVILLDIVPDGANDRNAIATQAIHQSVELRFCADIYAACGFRGQYVFLVPEHDLLVVVTAGGRGWAEEKAPREFLYDDILPALQR